MAWGYRSFNRHCSSRSNNGVAAGGVDHQRIDAELNALGADGWELAAVIPVFEDGVLASTS